MGVLIQEAELYHESRAYLLCVSLMSDQQEVISYLTSWGT
jgi:hypothetical protein